jgi:hypothetical protein
MVRGRAFLVEAGSVKANSVKELPPQELPFQGHWRVRVRFTPVVHVLDLVVKEAGGDTAKREIRREDGGGGAGIKQGGVTLRLFKLTDPCLSCNVTFQPSKSFRFSSLARNA